MVCLGCLVCLVWLLWQAGREALLLRAGAAAAAASAAAAATAASSVLSAPGDEGGVKILAPPAAAAAPCFRPSALSTSSHFVRETAIGTIFSITSIFVPGTLLIRSRCVLRIVGAAVITSLIFP